jgi:hypothetical protein
MGQEKENYHKLKELATSLGFRLFGVADISRLKEEFIFPPEVIKDLNYGIPFTAPGAGGDRRASHPALF